MTRSLVESLTTPGASVQSNPLVVWPHWHSWKQRVRPLEKCLPRALGCSRHHLLDLRHRLQHLAWVRLPRPPLPDATAEADEMFQNVEKKGKPHLDLDDPP